MNIRYIQLYKSKSGKYRACYTYEDNTRATYEISKEMYDEIELMLTHSPQQIIFEEGKEQHTYYEQGQNTR